MDPDLVRLLLVILGAFLVAGIYLWDRYKRNSVARPPGIRRRPLGDARIESFPLDATGDPAANEAPPPIETATDTEPSVAVDTSAPPAQGPEPKERQRRTDSPLDPDPVDIGDWGHGDRDPQVAMDLSFDAHGDLDYLHADPAVGDDVERLLVVINVVAQGLPFGGAAIESACASAGLQPGDMSIYHRREPGSGRVSFSMASMVEPGSFPLDAMSGFSTPGLTLFTQFPGVRDGLQIYDDMLGVARQLAVALKGDLQDERHNKLTRQMQEHTRETIVEHRRKVQLARSRR